jgi:hypothetical protein
MNPLLELLMKSGNGAAMTDIGAKFGLNEAQIKQAVEALTPAFSQGLKHSASDPAGMGKLLAAMLGGASGNYFDNPMSAASANGAQMGNAILGELFGSKDLSRAVAAQAAQATGLSQAVLKQLLPVLAPILLGGLFKMMTSGGGNNPLGRMFEEMLGGGRAQQRQPMPDMGAGNPWGQILEEMMGGGQSTGRRPSGPAGDNPLGRIFEEMMKGGQGAPRDRGSPRQAPMPTDNPLGRIIEEMMRGGQGAGRAGGGTAQDTGDNPLGDIFNEMLKGGKQPAPQPVEPKAEKRRAPAQERNQWNRPSEETRYQPPADGEASSQTKNGLEDLFGKMFGGDATPSDYQRGVEKIFEQFMGAGRKS